MPAFAWNVPLVSLIFLKRFLVFPILLFCSISLHWLLRKAFLSLLAILWNSAFKWVYLSFSPNCQYPFDHQRKQESSRKTSTSALLIMPKLLTVWKSLSRVQLTGVGSLSLLQGIFPTQELNPGLLYCRQILYQLSHNRSSLCRSQETVENC